MSSKHQPDKSQTDPAVELAVSEWLQSVPGLARQLDMTRSELSVSDSADKKSALRFLIRYLRYDVEDYARASLTAPPDQLVHALFQDGPRTIRDDAEELFLKNFAKPERFFLQACLPDVEHELVQSNPQGIQHSVTASAVALELAFGRTYEGNAKTRFKTALHSYNKQYNPKIHYGRVIAILQSSACGKSRLVKELSSEDHLISICLRSDTKLTSGWPPGDVAALQFFNTHSNGKYKGEELSAAFLGALTQVIADSIPIPESSSHDSDQPPSDPLATWKYILPNDSGPDRRAEYVNAVVSRATKMLREKKGWLERERAWISRVQEQPKDGHAGLSPSSSSSSASDQRDPLFEAPRWHENLFTQFCLEGFQALDAKVQALNKNDRFFIALDECGALGDFDPDDLLPSNSMSLIAMQRICKAADILQTKTVFWFLELDTNSKAFLLAPSGPRAGSERLRDGLVPLNPFVYLGFNQMAGHVSMKHPNEVLELRHLKMYGRPYWATLPDSAVVEYASRKLFWSATTTGFHSYNKSHVFAAFASRLPLELGQNEAATRFEAELVSHHMRMIVSVVRDKMETRAPSEPALALAAASALNEDREQYREALQILLNTLILQGLIIDRGAQGELCSRLLCIFTRDQIHTSFFNDQKSAVRSFTLAQWLSELAGSNYGCHDSASKALEPELRAFSEKAVMTWTHIHGLTRSFSEIPITLVEWAFSTGAAFQCSPNQDSVDMLFPAYVGPMNEPYDSLHLILIGEQSKARSHAMSKAVSDTLTVPHIVYPSVDGQYPVRRKQETLIIVMDLCATADFHGQVGVKSELTRRRAITPYDRKPNMKPKQRAKVWKGYSDPYIAETEPDNFLLNIRGRDSTQYPAIVGLEKEFQDLLEHSLSNNIPQEFKEMENEMEREMNPFED